MAVWVAVLLAFATASGCATGSARTLGASETGGDADHGRELLRKYRCASCHRIPGVAGADADVGPPLTRISRRSYLAGRVENTPGNMHLWIRNTEQIDERTAMPNTGVTDADARDIVSYLYTLE